MFHVASIVSVVNVETTMKTVEQAIPLTFLRRIRVSHSNIKEDLSKKLSSSLQISHETSKFVHSIRKILTYYLFFSLFIKIYLLTNYIFV